VLIGPGAVAWRRRVRVASACYSAGPSTNQAGRNRSTNIAARAVRLITQGARSWSVQRVAPPPPRVHADRRARPLQLIPPEACLSRRWRARMRLQCRCQGGQRCPATMPEGPWRTWSDPSPHAADRHPRRRRQASRRGGGLLLAANGLSLGCRLLSGRELVWT
jgi:hypothetical protein